MSEAPKLTAIYGLYDPRDDALRYIGKTIRPRVRLQQHYTPTGLHQPVNQWCRSRKGYSQSSRRKRCGRLQSRLRQEMRSYAPLAHCEG